MDAELTRMIYRRVPVLVNERTGENPWGVTFKQGLFNMTSDSGLFVTEPREGYVRLYEAKMIHQFDHRWATYDDSTDVRETRKSEKENPKFIVTPRYWVSNTKVEEKLENWNHRWLLGFRDIARSTDERTAIFSILPKVGVGHKIPLLFFEELTSSLIACFYGNVNSLPFDMVSRQKVASTSLSFFIVKQFPVLSPNHYSPTAVQFISSRILELTYTSYDLKPFAEDMGYYGEPFRWDEDRRALLRAELDAYYARLYGLNRKQLRYILDPADLTPRELEDILDPWEEVADPLDPQGYARRAAASDFPGETFRVLKEKELKQYGEYRTRRLVLEAWERLVRGELGAASGEEARSGRPVRGDTRPEPVVEVRSRPVVEPVREAPEPVKRESAVEEQEKEETPMQPALSDFGLYKCSVCGKMVMGFEKAKHEQEKHRSQPVGWKKLR